MSQNIEDDYDTLHGAENGEHSYSSIGMTKPGEPSKRNETDSKEDDSQRRNTAGPKNKFPIKVIVIVAISVVLLSTLISIITGVIINTSTGDGNSGKSEQATGGTEEQDNADALLLAVNTLKAKFPLLDSLATNCSENYEYLVSVYLRLNDTVNVLQTTQTAKSNSSGEVASQCPDGWTIFGSSFYLFANRPSSFTDAEYFCSQHGSHLVHIETADENSFLKSFVREVKVANHWIGLTDIPIEGIWNWTDTDTRAAFTDWHVIEPNQGESANCAALWSQAGFQ